MLWKTRPPGAPAAPYIIKGQREKRIRMELKASFTENNKIPIKMTDVVKNEASRGPHVSLHDQRSKWKKG
jgi:hypothetical protein